MCPFSNLSRNGCIQNELSTRGTGSLSYDATSRGKDTLGDEWVYERLTAVRPIPYFRLKCVIFPGATFGQANNRAYFSPEALVSRGKMKKKKQQNKKLKKKERKKRKYKYKPTSRHWFSRLRSKICRSKPSRAQGKNLWYPEYRLRCSKKSTSWQD